MLYITFLPLGLWQHLGYATVAVAPMIAFLLAGIENIGIMIENPMRILPMAAFCVTIQYNVMDVGADWAAGNHVRIFHENEERSTGVVMLSGLVFPCERHLPGPR
jgi:predicted membrane chloride channel (bestrophin family)